MKQDLEISIIMPAYNAEKFISQAINSVINQSYDKWELIVIDDCSKDDTAQIIREYELQDKRIRRIVNEENLGASKTRNKGVSLAHYDWVAFLDCDDMWEREKLEKQVLLLESDSTAELIFTGSAFMNHNGEKKEHILQVPSKVSYEELLKQNIISCSSVMIKKKYLLMYTMPGDEMHEDFSVWLRVLKEIPCAHGINEPLLIYRLSENSKSSNKVKAAMMTYRVYKFVGLNWFQRMYYMFFYAYRSLKKYSNL